MDLSGGTLILGLFVGLMAWQGAGVLAVGGIYVNNQKIDKFEADRIKLLYPAARPTPVTDQPETTNSFIAAQHAHQQLTASYIDQLWGRNKTHFPSLLRVDPPPPSASPSAPVHLDDEQSPIKNTLNNTSPAYLGDYQRVPRPASAKPSKPNRRLKKRPKPQPTPGVIPVVAQLSPPQGSELPPETLALLSRYYSFSCTLTPKQRSQPIPTTSIPPTTTRKTRGRVTTVRPPTPTTTTSVVPGKRKKTTVYVDPPMFNRIGGMLESVYSFVESALTSTEYVPDSQEVGGGGGGDVGGGVTEHATTSISHKLGASKVKRNARNISSTVAAILARIGGSSGSAEPETTDPWLAGTAPTTGSTGSSTSSGADSSSESSKRFTPDRVTLAGVPVIVSDGNKNKMTTNIQVTSEYTAATPPTVPLPAPGSSEENDSSEDDDESDEDYFGGFGGFNDEEDEDDDDDDDEDEGGQSVARPGGQGLVNDKLYDDEDENEDEDDDGGTRFGVKGTKKRRRKKRPADSEESSEYSDESDDDDDDEGEESYDERDDGADDEDADEGDDEDDDEGDDDSGDAAEGFFGGLFSSFGRFVRSLGFGGAARGTPDDEDERWRGRSTTPRGVDTRRRPTRSTSSGVESQPGAPSSLDRTPWLGLPPAYLFNEIQDDDESAPEVPVLEAPPEIASEAGSGSGWFELMMPWDFFNPWAEDSHVESQEQAQEPVVIHASASAPPSEQAVTTSAPSSAGSGWLSQIFGGGGVGTTPSPTHPPKTTSPRPEQLLSALAQYLVQATPSTRPPHPKPKRRKSYAGYQLWRVAASGGEQLERLEDLRRSPEGRGLQWWSGPAAHEPTDVLVAPGAAADRLREYLLEEGLRYEPTIGDLGRAIAYENPRVTRRDQIETELLHGHPLTWYRYHRYADIVKFVDFLARRHPQQVRLLHIGRSYEGRPLTVVRVSFGRTGRKLHSQRRPAAVIVAGTRGHQWIGPAVATWLLQHLLAAPNASDPTPASDLETIRSYDWYVLPVANPDGYEFTHEHDRMWSKSRSRPDHRPPPGLGQALLSGAFSWWNAEDAPSAGHGPDQPSGTCYGVDLERNWAYRWQETPGSSRSECSANFGGPDAFSEPETRAVRDFLLTGRRNVRLFLSLQAYGQSLRYPPAPHDPEQAHGDVHEMAAVGLEAMRGAGGEQTYTLGRAEEGGTATGYARYAAGIRYSYTLRLPDTGTHGFLFPPSNIVSTARDTFELIKGMIDYS